MSVIDPLFEDEDTESFERAIVWLKLNLCETTQQWCASASRRAVDQYVLFCVSDAVYYSLCSVKYALDLAKPFSLDDFLHKLIVLLLAVSGQ